MVTSELSAIRRELLELRSEMTGSEWLEAAALERVTRAYRRSARNLIHDVAMRRRDLRQLQSELSRQGLSSLDRSAAHALASVSRVIDVVDRLLGKPEDTLKILAPCDKSVGSTLYNKHVQRLFGTRRGDCPPSLIVTMPREAAADDSWVRDRLAAGVDCLRIDCARDDRATWAAMLRHLEKARTELHAGCTVLMDLAAPSMATGAIQAGPSVVKIRPARDAYGRNTRPAHVLLHGDAPASAAVGSGTPLQVDRKWLATLKEGDTVRFLDTRGRKRRLVVAKIRRGHVCTELSRTAYLTNGTILHRSGSHKHTVDKTQVVGIGPTPQTIALSPGDLLILTSDAAPGTPAVRDSMGLVLSPARIGCTVPDALRHVQRGERVLFDGGRIMAVAMAGGSSELTLKIAATSPRDARLQAATPIAFPDSSLDLSAINGNDSDTVNFAAENADLVGLSIFNHERDVQLLVDRLKTQRGTPPGIMLKLQRGNVYSRLHTILLTAMQHVSFGVQIAGVPADSGAQPNDLALRDILRICEAAHCPVIHAAAAEIQDPALGGPARRATRSPSMRRDVYTQEVTS